jgi:hypothetical protein
MKFPTTAEGAQPYLPAGARSDLAGPPKSRTLLWWAAFLAVSLALLGTAIWLRRKRHSPT